MVTAMLMVYLNLSKSASLPLGLLGRLDQRVKPLCQSGQLLVVPKNPPPLCRRGRRRTRYSRRRPAKAGVVATDELVNATAPSGDPDVSWAKIASGGSWHRQTLPARACSSHFQAFRLTRSYQLTPWVGRRREPAPRPRRRGCRLGATKNRRPDRAVQQSLRRD